MQIRRRSVSLGGSRPEWINPGRRGLAGRHQAEERGSMTYFPDMDTATMIDAGDHVRAVGWLSAARPHFVFFFFTT